MMRKKIILAGGTGNIGKLLSHAFLKIGWEVIILSRKAQESANLQFKYVKWDGKTLGDWSDSLEDADTVINLSGKSIQCRFTEENKKVLLSSRIEPTKILGEAIQNLTSPPRLWINFSGISLFEGLEGIHNEESTQSGNTFLANLTKEWEKTFFDAETPNTNKVCLRLSPVLSHDFGMFKELYPLAKLGLGGKVGNGKQMVSWIHEQDLVRLVSWVVNHASPSRLYHACTPEPESNGIFMKNLRTVLGMPIGLPLPTPLAKVGAFFKGMESDMLLLTNSVYAKRPSQEGFEYQYPTTILAFKHLTKK